MSGELKIATADGATYWFGRDDHFPDEVRVYGGDPHHWSYMRTAEAHELVRQSLTAEGEVQQGDAERFFWREEGETIGD